MPLAPSRWKLDVKAAVHSLLMAVGRPLHRKSSAHLTLGTSRDSSGSFDMVSLIDREIACTAWTLVVKSHYLDHALLETRLVIITYQLRRKARMVMALASATIVS